MIVTLKDVLRFLIDANDEQLDVVRIVLEIPRAKAAPPVELSPTAITDYAGDAYRGVMRRRRRAKAKKAKATVPPSKAKRRQLALQKVARKPRPDSAVGKVWAALRQSSGQISAKDLSHILELPQGVVTTSMLRLLRGHPSVLKREWKKGRVDGDTLVKGEYLYTYLGKVAS